MGDLRQESFNWPVKFLKKYFTSLNLIFALEIVVIVLASFGLIPREAVLILTGLMVFYMIFSPVEDALWLVVASIPFFVALPVTENFDSMANWRILIAVLFLCLFFKKGVSVSLVKDSNGRWRLRENVKHYLVGHLLWLFLTIAALSILVADFKILAVKKLLFLINIFLLYLVIRNLLAKIGGKESVIKIWQAAAAGGIVVIVVGLIQFLSVLFAPLFAFWQFWADKVINVFYGQNLAHLLSYSNTWFSYYSVNPPTLRLFSVFPDSHSFAMFCILMIPIFLSLALYFNADRKKRIFYRLLAGLAFFGIVLSGSRGAWLGVVPVIAVALYFLGKKTELVLTKKALLGLGVFVLLFFASVGYPPLLYTFQSWQGSNASTTFSFFERAKSISDLEELSNKSRLEIWGASLKSVARHPFLGVGLGNYFNVLGESTSAAKKGASAHNLYLDFASEIGIFGALVLIVIFANILYTAWLVFRAAKEPLFKIYGLLVGLYFLWVAAYSFFDVVFLNDKVLLLAMVGLATLYNIRNIIFESEKI